MLRVLVAAATVVLLSGCQGSELDTGEGDDAIIGGKLASGEEWNAIGALVSISGTGSNVFSSSYCTATLIAPRLILTAEHCVTHGKPNPAFAIGPIANGKPGATNGRGPAKLVRLGEAHIEKSIRGGAANFGSDVAVIELDESVSDITPLRVGELSESDIGGRFSAVGYGLQEDTSFGARGTRYYGSVTLRALKGKVLPLVAGSLERYQELYGDRSDETTRYYESTALIEGYEALTSRVARGDVQICTGDSGGPLLAKRDGEQVVVGVASWTLSSKKGCDLGSVYARFGPAAKRLIDRELARSRR